MGNSQLKRCQQKLGWTGLPDTERATYFAERLMMGWFELLCCPSAMGCTILLFEPKNPEGGEPKYRIKLRLSHSEYVPRYQLHVVKDGQTKPWIVGHMEKTETHLRAKPGEFVRVQIWSLTCNSMVMETRRSELHRNSQPCYSAVKDRPTPSAVDMQTRGLSIATQAKLDMTMGGEDGDCTVLDMNTERWVQTIGVDSRACKVSIEAPRGAEGAHRSMKSMSVLRILHKGQKVCVARKQRFAGALGRIEQPFLGVQIRPSDYVNQQDEATAGEDGEASPLKSLMDTSNLMLLLMCLAWSEETMSPHLDMTDRFIQAMKSNAGEHGGASERGLSGQWDIEDVRSRLRQYDYARLHNWAKAGPAAEDNAMGSERPPPSAIESERPTMASERRPSMSEEAGAKGPEAV